MLIDHAKIYVIAGAGGDGCRSLFKDIFNRKGIPDGGDGGSGGSVIITADPHLHTLLDFKFNRHFKADRGKHGGSNKKNGKRGKILVVRVPVGTIVKDALEDIVLRDLAKPGESFIVAKGGDGGIGTAKKREATAGKSGEEKTLILELKLLADVGIIGFPNAGKSTIVSSISKIHTKIADYPFTTKSPKLGVVKYNEDSFVVADMPGLIEGAHTGKGLGDKFLRHIERTFILVHVVDACPIDGSDPYENYVKLEKELQLYDEKLYNKPRIVAVNKMDLTGAEESLEILKKKIDMDITAISAVKREGLNELIAKMYRRLKNAKKELEENSGEDWDESPDE